MCKKTNISTRLAISVFLIAISAAIAEGKIIYVDDNAVGANDGSSWADAYNYLQEALADAKSAEKPVEIRVAQGIYTPDQGLVAIPEFDWRTATFQLINDVTLKGGYVGFGEPNPDARDIEIYETILSGDLNGDDAQVAELLDLLYEPTQVENSCHVVSSYYSDESAVLDGFTITAGNANGPESADPNSNGAGLYNFQSSPTVINCVFTGNSARWSGAGMHNICSSPVVINCTFNKNSAGTSSGGHGGGMSNNSGSNPILTNCKFSSNWAGQGGGINALCCAPITNSCKFIDNSANFGGGVQYKDSIGPKFFGCTFSGNSAHKGAAARFIKSSPILTNCIFRANSAGNYGGAIAFTNMSTSTLANCTFAANTSPQGRALACDHVLYGPSDIYIMNSIFWNGGNEIWNKDGSTIDISYSNIHGDIAGVFDPCDTVIWGEGNIDVDPLFADPDNWDYHLKSQAGRWDPVSGSWVKDDVISPCIDAGNPGSDWTGEIWPHGERINMGAYGGTRQASMSSRPESMSLPTVAYIYLYDDQAVESFRSFLVGYGCSTTLIELDQVAATPLDSYDLIIVGDDTGYLSKWGDDQSVAAIETLGKPVIGLGEGGYAFFGKLGLSIGWTHGGHASRNSIYVIDPNSSLFSTPYPISIPQDRILQLYTETNHVGLYLYPVPETVTALGGEVNSPGYYPLALEHDRYLLWGFTESPEYMTEVGKKLFINVVIWTANAAWET